VSKRTPPENSESALDRILIVAKISMLFDMSNAATPDYREPENQGLRLLYLDT